MRALKQNNDGIEKKKRVNLKQDFTCILQDGKVLSQQNNYQQRELERLTQQKISLEMQILEKLQDQSKHDKALQHHARTIKTLKDSNKIQVRSLYVSNSDNELVVVMLLNVFTNRKCHS